jgi:hypothetical protein
LPCLGIEKDESGVSPHALKLQTLAMISKLSLLSQGDASQVGKSFIFWVSLSFMEGRSCSTIQRTSLGRRCSVKSSAADLMTRGILTGERAQACGVE